MKIGIIGCGDMGRMMVKALCLSKINSVIHVIDLPIFQTELDKLFTNYPNVFVEDKYEGVCLDADFLLFCVETHLIEKVVSEAAPYISPRTIVGGQTSIKTPEILAFEKHLKSEVPIISIHSLHGPNVDPIGQTLLLIPHRNSSEELKKAKELWSYTGSTIQVLTSYEEHDKLMADVQVVTHVGFESIGTSFMHRGIFPWENPLHQSGLDNLKLLFTLRIFSYKPHVYSGLAIKNPFAKKDVRTYAAAENELFGLMISEDEKALRKLLNQVKRTLFPPSKKGILLSENQLNNFFLEGLEGHKANSHLSLLSMAYTWYKLKANPFDNLICQTPPFKIRVAMVEYLFRNESLLEESIQTALFDKSIRKDDLAFHTAVQEWANIVESENIMAYNSHFEKTKAFLSDRLEEGRKLSSLLIESMAKNG